MLHESIGIGNLTLITPNVKGSSYKTVLDTGTWILDHNC